MSTEHDTNIPGKHLEGSRLIGHKGGSIKPVDQTTETDGQFSVKSCSKTFEKSLYHHWLEPPSAKGEQGWPNKAKYQIKVLLQTL